jgi:hypothetical protein
MCTLLPFTSKVKQDRGHTSTCFIAQKCRVDLLLAATCNDKLTITMMGEPREHTREEVISIDHRTENREREAHNKDNNSFRGSIHIAYSI